MGARHPRHPINSRWGQAFTHFRLKVRPWKLYLRTVAVQITHVDAQNSCRSFAWLDELLYKPVCSPVACVELFADNVRLPY